jgi:hypothetical protein
VTANFCKSAKDVVVDGQTFSVREHRTTNRRGTEHRKRWRAEETGVSKMPKSAVPFMELARQHSQLGRSDVPRIQGKYAVAGAQPC